jgi:hypothetical protein
MATTIDISGVAEDALNLKQMLDGVLERVEAIYQSYNVSLPNRRYWTMGQPAVDCEQVVVSFIQMYLGPVGAEINSPQRCNVPRTATLTISVAREVPVVGQNGQPPSTSKIQQVAAYAAIDAWVLMQSVNLLDQWDSSGYGPGVLATVEVGEPEGGLQSTTLQITMAVP